MSCSCPLNVGCLWRDRWVDGPAIWALVLEFQLSPVLYSSVLEWIRWTFSCIRLWRPEKCWSFVGLQGWLKSLFGNWCYENTLQIENLFENFPPNSTKNTIYKTFLTIDYPSIFNESHFIFKNDASDLNYFFPVPKDITTLLVYQLINTTLFLVPHFLSHVLSLRAPRN